jgi:hypothetical protein
MVLRQRLRTRNFRRDRRSSRLLPAQHPHEKQLDDVGVDEQELRPSVALCARDGVGVAAADSGVVGGVGEEDVF